MHLATDTSAPEQLDAILRQAEATAGRAGMTTHEAKAYFRSSGHPELADRVHDLLVQLATAAYAR